MAAIGSLIFCTDCGNLLDPSTGDPKAILTCHVCGKENPDTSSKVVTTKSKPNAFPSALRSKHSAVQELATEDVPTGALTQETCPRCGNREMRFYTLQLRSADEGSTVFYNCENCGHKHSTNN